MQFKTLTLATLVGLVTAQAEQNLTQALSNSTELTSFQTLLAQVPYLVAQLANATNITILAPNNGAVSAFQNSSAFQAAQSDSGLIDALLRYHVLNGTFSQFSENRTFIPTILTNETYTNVTGGQTVEIQNSTIFSGERSTSSVLQQSVNFTGGVVHIIDSILTLPQSVSSTATAFNLTSAYGALNATGLLGTVDGLSDITVFLPNNAAFQSIGSALPALNMSQITDILTYHVVNGTVAYSTTLSNTSVPTLQGNDVNITVAGNSVFVNNARVIIPDILVANGVVHVIDEVLNPNNVTVSNGTSSEGAPAFSGASSVTEAPYTSGVPTPTSSIATESLASSAATQAAGTSSSSAGAWSPKGTGAAGAAAAAAAIGGLAFLL